MLSCCSSIEKARQSKKRQHASAQLSHAERLLNIGFRHFIDNARKLDVVPLLEAKNIDGVLALLDLPVQRFAASWNATFVDVGLREARSLDLVQKAKGSVSGVFDPGDKAAADIMRRSNLNLITNLTREQKKVVRSALVSGLNRGLGSRELARTISHSAGLSNEGIKYVESYRRSLESGNAANAMDRALRDERFDGTLNRLADPDDSLSELSQSRIDRMTQQYANNWQRYRSESIARTESLMVTSQARDAALRQSANAVGQSLSLIGIEWISTHDARTRDAHAQRDGARRRLGDQFVPGVTKPGEGPASEVCNCRCQPIYEMFSNEEELEQWISQGT